MDLSNIYKTIYAISIAQGWPMEEPLYDNILTLEDRVFIIKSKAHEAKITLEDTIKKTLEDVINNSFKKLNIRPDLKLIDKRNK